MLVKIMLRAAALFILSGALLAPAQEFSVDGLFRRPYVWGTTPTQLTWAKHAHLLVFLWNEKGGAFRDLYAFNADTRKLARLTDLEHFDDPFNTPEVDKDKHRREFLLPPGGLTTFDVAEDGTKVVFDFHGDLWMVTPNNSTLQRLTKTKLPETSPKFSPSGAALAYTQAGQLFVLHLGGGPLEQITDIHAPASLISFAWAPNGKQFTYSVRPLPGRSVLLPNYSGQFVTSAPFVRNVAGDQPEALQHFVVEANGDNPRLLDAGKGFSFGLPQWSYDSKHLLLVSEQPNYKKAELRAASPDTAKSTVVFEQSDDRWVEQFDYGWAPDSKHVWLTSDRSGFQHLYTAALDGTGLRQLTKGDWEIHKDTFSHSPQWIGDFLYFSSTQAGTSERAFYRLKSDGSTLPERLSKGEGLSVANLSEDGQKQAVLTADLLHPFDLFVDGERVTNSPQPAFSKLPWAESRFVHYPSLKDHKPVAARLLLPPGYDPADPTQKPRPAILYIHGSGYATSVLKQWGSYQDLRFVFNNVLAHDGYVVLEMDYRGSTGYGRDWRSGVYLDMGGPDLDDVLGGVEYLKTLKNVDTSRLGIWGWSYGGFMTSMALFRAPTLFACGAAFSGVYDWENYNAVYTGERLTTPAENPEAYRRSSPIHFSNQLKNHLLIVHGIVDNNVMFQDAVQLSEKLVHEGKSYDESFYPEESHAYLRDETLRDAFGRTARYFAQYLAGH